MPSQLIIFRATSDLVARRHHNGREYLIAPVVALRQGVLNGALVLAEEYSKFVEAWNGIPIPLGHPQDSSGVYLSCNTPDLVAQCPGRFYNAHMDGDRLLGEMWIDIELAKSIGGKALIAARRLEANEPIEVSTAYFADVDDSSGEWNGQHYDFIQRNFRPNHLALLLDEKGACSWQMGCGVPRVNKTEVNPMELVVIHNDLSLDEQMSRVYNAFNEQFCSSAPMPGQEQPYIREVFADKVIVRYDGKLFSYPYTLADDGAVTFAEPVEVEMVYQPVTANVTEPPATNQETPPATVPAPPAPDLPIANEQTGLIAVLKKILGIQAHEPGQPCPMQANCQQAAATNSGGTANNPTAPGSSNSATITPSAAQNSATAPATSVQPGSVTAPAANAQPAALSADEQTLLALVQEQGGVEKVKAGLQALKDAAAAERTNLVTAITANTRAFTAEDLNAMSTEQLKKLRDATLPADFSGRGTPRNNSQSAETLVEAPMPG